ncbi:hypothetical protein ACH0CA_11040 [Kytococcus sedentarius]|uniref:hypothetical protein n=1 Tax=Kytococcus sedentarius TaxID=1276 RepID=UPI003879B106
MAAIYAATIVLAAIALGEVISIVTKARVPSLLVALLAMMVAVQVGLFPKDVVDASMLAALSAITTPAIMVHMGTLLPMSVLKAQWRSVVIAIAAMAGACALILPIIGLMFGYGEAVAGAGPVAGGIISTLVTVEGLNANGQAALATIPPLILMLQFLPAMPLTNWILRKYAAHLVEEGRSGGQGTTVVGPDLTGEDDSNLRLPKSWVDSAPVLFFLLVAVGAVSYWLGEVSGISYSLWGLGLGILLAFVGFLPQRAMERANAFTPAMVAIIAVVMVPLTQASMSDILDALGPVVAILVIGLVGVVAGGWIASKLVGWDWRLGVPVALTAMLGFPADYIISQEVARSASDDPAEQDRVLGQILPAMLVGGFTSVSAGSIVVASILVSTL